MRYRYKIVALFTTLCLASAGLVGCGKSSTSNDTTSSTKQEAPAQNDTSNTPAASESALDTPVEFDNLTLVFGSNITTTTLNNQFSPHDGKTVLIIPVTVTNNAKTSHKLNMFYHKTYSPSGVELATISSYFTENDIDFSGELRPGATGESLLHVLYEGNGDYLISLAKPSGKATEIKVPVALP